MRYTVIIVTRNRARSLADTLAALSRTVTGDPWEVIVADNHSSDDTEFVVRSLARTFPVPLRYVYEPVDGKYAAMNTAIAAAEGEIIAATDDDAIVAPDWLDRAGAGLERMDCDFVGGPVTPLWEATPPSWLDLCKPAVQKVLALLDHGPEPREFGERLGWPLGVNVAYRRRAFANVGLFDPSLGRKAGTLRSQAQREWHLRARAVGLRGFYLPDMRVQHRVEVARLRKQYFRRWYYWHGISRARMYYRYGFDPQEPERARYDRPLPYFLGVPRGLIRKAVASLRSYVWRRLRGRTADAFTYEMWLCFFAGMVVQCRREAGQGFRGAARAAAPGEAGVTPVPLASERRASP